MVKIELSEFDAAVVFRCFIEFQKQLIGSGYDTVIDCLGLVSDKLAASLNEVGDSGG